MSERERAEMARLLRAFLPRMSEATAQAWTEMICAERAAPITVHEKRNGQYVPIVLRVYTQEELRVACMAVARTMGPNDWPAPKLILDELARERRRQVAAEAEEMREQQPRLALPERTERDDAKIEQAKREAQKILAYLAEKVSIQHELRRQGGAAKPSIGPTLSDDIEAANARRAELRRQAEDLIKRDKA